MVIKLKSKNSYIAAVVIAVCFLSFFLLAFSDIKGNHEVFTKDPYESNINLRDDVNRYVDNVQRLAIDFNNYPQKTEEEKVTEEDIIKEVEQNKELFEKRKREIVKQYKEEIGKLIADGDKNSVIKLINEKNQKINEAANIYIKSTNSIKMDIIIKKDSQYEKIKQYVERRGTIKYYLIDEVNKKNYTNIDNISDIQNYIKNNALYSVKFPQDQQIDSYQGMLNNRFRNNNIEAYFIIPRNIKGFNQTYASYVYLKSIRDRLYKELAMCIVALILGLSILIYLRRNKELEDFYFKKIMTLYERIPIDIRIIIFIFYSSIISGYLSNNVYFYIPISIHHFTSLIYIAIYVLYVIMNIKHCISLIKNKNTLKSQWSKSIIYKLILMPLIECKKMKKVFLKVNLILFLTGLYVVFLVVLFYKTTRYGDSGSIIGAFVAIIVLSISYALFISALVLKKVSYLNEIIYGSEEIVAGNLDYVIEEKGKDGLFKLSHNINNMRNGFKTALENQIKSERFKTELITNVSHDLKTPLTSIINYINLLKKEDLSDEEKEGYIGVLDRKSERLKVLIDDLFEASKLSCGAVELNIENVDVVALLRQAMGEFDEKIKNSSLTFRINTLKPNMYARLDGKKTWRVFENLIGNILKYSQPNTRVFIDIVEENKKIIVTMKNISAYEMNFKAEELFERFKRGDEARNTEGSGLGLAIAKSIVELQEGKMDIDIDGDLFKIVIEFNGNVHRFV